VNIYIDYTVVQRLSDEEIITAHAAWTRFREVWRQPVTLTYVFDECGKQIVESTVVVLPSEQENEQS
jgi:hypothetical protein